MVLIQIVAALLLLLGSALIFRALVAIEAPSRPAPIIRRRFDRPELAAQSRRPAPRPASRRGLPRAA